MRRVLCTAPGTVVVTAADEPAPPGPGDVLVRARLGLVSAGTERRIVRGEPMPVTVATGFADRIQAPAELPEPRPLPDTNGPVPPIYPCLLGYNMVGEIEAVGDGVSADRVGERTMTTGPHDERMVLPAWQCAPVPHEVPDEEAVFAYLATLGLHALRRVGCLPGSRVAVVGLGTVGLPAALVAAAHGASVVGIDPSAPRRALAAAAGVTVAAPDGVDTVAANLPADHVIETAGTDEALALGLRIVRPGGAIGVIALHPDPPRLPLLGDLFHEKACSLVSCVNDPTAPPGPEARFTVTGNMLHVLDLMRRGAVRLDGALARTYAVERAADAYAAVAGNGDPDHRPLGVGLSWPAESPREAP